MSMTDKSITHQVSTQKETRKVLLITFLLNLAVALAKLAYGYYTKSLSLTADGYHSLFDSAANIVGIVALLLAFKPPDDDHPYGHQKIETIAALAIASLLFVTCFELISGVVDRLKNPQIPHVDLISFGVMISTLIINFGVSRYELLKSRELKSEILKADALHTSSDIYVTVAVLVSFVAVLLHFPKLDLLIACGIALFIVFTAFQIIYENFNVLLDGQQIDPTEIEKIVRSLPLIVDCHKIRSRGSPSGVFVDLHIHVDPHTTVEAAHRLTHQVIKRIKKQFPEVHDVLIHTEPSYSTEPYAIED